MYKAWHYSPLISREPSRRLLSFADCLIFDVAFWGFHLSCCLCAAKFSRRIQNDADDWREPESVVASHWSRTPSFWSAYSSKFVYFVDLFGRPAKFSIILLESGEAAIQEERRQRPLHFLSYDWNLQKKTELAIFLRSFGTCDVPVNPCISIERGCE